MAKIRIGPFSTNTTVRTVQVNTIENHLNILH
jgi:hypothetical protein